MLENILFSAFDAMYPYFFSLFVSLLTIGLCIFTILIIEYISLLLKRFFFVRRRIKKYCEVYMKDLRKRKRIVRKKALQEFRSTKDYRTLSGLISVATLREEEDDM